MSNQLLLDVFVKSDKLCKLWLFLFIFPTPCLILLAVAQHFIGENTTMACMIVLVLLMMALFVLDLVWSISVMRDSSKILSTILTCPESEHHKTLKFARNILMASWACIAIVSIIAFVIIWSIDITGIQTSLENSLQKLKSLDLTNLQSLNIETIMGVGPLTAGLFFVIFFLAALFNLVSKILFFIKIKKFRYQLNSTRFVA